MKQENDMVKEEEEEEEEDEEEETPEQKQKRLEFESRSVCNRALRFTVQLSRRNHF